MNKKVYASNIKCSPFLEFNDIPSTNIFCPYIEFLKYQKIISGYEDNTFRPNKNLTRGETAKIIVQGFKIEKNLEGENFPDISKDNPFFNHILTLKNHKIINGYNDGEFKANSSVTRAAFLKFLVNSVKHKNNSLFNNSNIDLAQNFKDVDNEHEFAKYIKVALNEELISGFSDKTFRPEKNISRQAAAKILSNTMIYANIKNLDCSENLCKKEIINKFETELEIYLFDLINESKIENKLNKLIYEENIAKIAKENSIHLDQINSLEHNKDLLSDIKSILPDTTSSAENIAKKTLFLDDAKKEYFDGLKKIHYLMMSETPPNDSHRKNILNPELNYLGNGIKIVYDENNNIVKIWITEDFAKI